MAGMPKLETTVGGITFPNPFVIASGPPGTNARVICRAFKEGWGGAVAKTVTLDASRIINVAPRYGRLKDETGDPYGWENIELISTTPLEDWIDQFKEIKDRYPDRVLIASVMEEYNKDAWFEVIERCEAAGVDMFECNFSCPHGLPERKMGSAMGQDCEVLSNVCSWVRQATKLPVWAKMTPNITHIEDPSRACLKQGIDGISAINTIRSVIGVDLETLRPQPTVEGYTTVGGYSCKAIKPIALRMTMEIATLIRQEFPGATLSAIGGIESGNDAAEFLLLGADTVQVCTGVMKHGYQLVGTMIDQLLAFMEKHGFETIDDFRGHSLPYFTTHSDLVAMQAKAKAKKHAARQAAGVLRDENWDSENFVQQSDELVGN